MKDFEDGLIVFFLFMFFVFISFTFNIVGSFALSAYKAGTQQCDTDLEIDKYLKGNWLCPANKKHE